MSIRGVDRIRVIAGVTTVLCVHCGEYKPPTEFNIVSTHRRVGSGVAYHSWCKRCKVVVHRDYVNHKARLMANTYVHCAQCAYPVKGCDLKRGKCPECRALTGAPRGMRSGGYDGHEERMQQYQQLAARNELLERKGT